MCLDWKIDILVILIFSKSALIPLLYCKFECIWMNTDKEKESANDRHKKGKGEGNKKKYWERMRLGDIGRDEETERRRERM